MAIEGATIMRDDAGRTFFKAFSSSGPTMGTPVVGSVILLLIIPVVGIAVTVG